MILRGEAARLSHCPTEQTAQKWEGKEPGTARGAGARMAQTDS